MTDIKAIDTGFDYDSPISRAARSGRMIAEHSTEAAPIIGHLTIGIYGDGTYSCGFVMPENHIIGPTFFVAYVREIIARELTGQLAADDYAKEYLS